MVPPAKYFQLLSKKTIKNTSVTHNMTLDPFNMMNADTWNCFQTSPRAPSWLLIAVKCNSYWSSICVTAKLCFLKTMGHLLKFQLKLAFVLGGNGCSLARQMSRLQSWNFAESSCQPRNFFFFSDRDWFHNQLSCSCMPSKTPERDDEQEPEATVSLANAKETETDVAVAVH